MRLDVHLTINSPDVVSLLNHVLSKLTHMENTIMPSIDDLKDKAAAILAQITSDTANDTAAAALIAEQATTITTQAATILDLQTQLAAAGADPAKLQEISDTLDQVAAADTANAAIVSAAVGTHAP